MTPIRDCEYQDPDDGCCLHPDNHTPECHVWACPRLAPFVERLATAAQDAYDHLGERGYAYEGPTEWAIMDGLKYALGAADGAEWALEYYRRLGDNGDDDATGRHHQAQAQPEPDVDGADCQPRRDDSRLALDAKAHESAPTDRAHVHATGGF